MAIVKRLFWQLGTHFSGRCHCREVVIVERFKRESMYGQFVDQKLVAVVERWPLVEVRLYFLGCVSLKSLLWEALTGHLPLNMHSLKTYPEAG